MPIGIAYEKKCQGRKTPTCGAHGFLISSFPCQIIGHLFNSRYQLFEAGTEGSVGAPMMDANPGLPSGLTMRAKQLHVHEVSLEETWRLQLPSEPRGGKGDESLEVTGNKRRGVTLMAFISQGGGKQG